MPDWFGNYEPVVLAFYIWIISGIAGHPNTTLTATAMSMLSLICILVPTVTGYGSFPSGEAVVILLATTFFWNIAALAGHSQHKSLRAAHGLRVVYFTVSLFTRSLLSATIVGMEMIQSALPFVQITLAVLLVAAVLLQQRGSSLGGAFGGDNFSASFHKRRGGELFLFRASVVLAILFVASTLLNVII